MTSLLRSKANNKTLPYPSGAVVMTYGTYQVVPFTFDKETGVLDFDFSTGFNASTEIESNNTVYIYGASFESIRVVNNIGPNITAWLENNGADEGTVKILEKPLVVRATQIAVGREPNGDNTFREINKPFDLEKASGSASNNWNATYLFRKPLVVEYKKSGVPYYRLFNTQFEGNT